MPPIEPPKILLVEDESAIADTVVYALRTEGLQVEWCTTARDAEAFLASHAVDLIILDVGLPDKRGFDLCREIRRTLSTPIVFLTARSEEVDRIVGFELGADDYVTKPFSPRELVARVRAILRRMQQGGGEVSSVQAAASGVEAGAATPSIEDVKATPSLPFVIDSNRYTISYFGCELALSRYEYQILVVLISRPGWVFTRDQLMTRVWDDPNSSMERTVDAHIKAIRAALRKVRPEVDAIITHRGIGYALRDEW